MYRRLGGPQGRSGRVGKSPLAGIRSPDRPARCESLYRLSHRGSLNYVKQLKDPNNCTSIARPQNQNAVAVTTSDQTKRHLCSFLLLFNKTKRKHSSGYAELYTTLVYVTSVRNYPSFVFLPFFQPGRAEFHPFRLSRGEICRIATRNTPPPSSSEGENLTNRNGDKSRRSLTSRHGYRPTDPL